MRALVIPAAGEQPQLADVPTPTVTEGSVLVRVHAAGLNPLDNHIADGLLAQMLPHEYPLVLGRDAAGVVEAVGAGVDHVAVGDEVIGHLLIAPPLSLGTLAEYALLPAAAVARKPAALDFTTAAALPLAGAAAVDCIEAAAVTAGQVVLVNGASGGVGSLAVQLLVERGATVVATGTAANADRLVALGASRVLDHTATPIVEQVRAFYPDGVDALINLAGMDPDAAPVGAVRKGGYVASLTPLPDDQALAQLDLTGSRVLAGAVREVVGPLADKVADGSLVLPVAVVLTLSDAAQGLRLLAAGGVGGKIVVTVD